MISGKRIKVAIVGNSNSVQRPSYANRLKALSDLDVKNFSIGGTTNVILLDFISVAGAFDFDFIFIETCVVEYMQRKNYPESRAAETLELFLRLIRSISAAKIVIVAIPTRWALTDTNTNWQESLYRSTADRFGIPILDGFSLIRRLIAGPQADIPDVFNRKISRAASRAKRLVQAFSLPGNLSLPLTWMGMLSPAIETNALGIFAYGDHAHLSPEFHNFFADLLYDFICAEASSGPDIAAEGEAYRSIVLGTYAEQGRFIDRNSSLISRRLCVLNSGEAARYPCPEGYHAYGILVNEAATSGILRFSSPAGNAELDIVPSWENWSARIFPILDPVGGGFVDVALHGRDSAYVGERGMGASIGPDTTIAELGELILVRSDWREVLPLPRGSTATALHIEDRPASRRITERTARQVARIIEGINIDGHFVSRECYDTIVSVLARDDGALTVAERAGLLLLLDADKRAARLVESLSMSHDDGAADGIVSTIRMLEREENVTSRELLSAAVAKVRAGAIEEGESDFAQGLARFPMDIGFFIERAWVPSHRRDWPEACARWALVRDVFPGHINGYVGLVMALRNSRRFDEAEAVLNSAMSVFPDTASLAADHACVALDRGDEAEAIKRMLNVRDRFPDHRENRNRLAVLLERHIEIERSERQQPALGY